MAVKKSQLYSTLWESCDALRGGMDPSQYKDYVLVILFVKYISDKKKAGDDMLDDIPEGCLFDDFIALKYTPNIGEEINKRLETLASAFALDNVFTNADFNNEDKLGKGQDKVDTVSSLIEVFENKDLDFGSNRAGDDDLIGDAYEYLMRNFASHSGKSKGQFYTPAEVSRLIAKILDIKNNTREQITIYDPACGSGSLLLRAMAEAKSHNRAIGISGQEKDLATINMARMNMILHGVYAADLYHGDTLNAPGHRSGFTLDTFDYVVANPPFSLKKWMKSAKANDDYGRWKADAVPPKQKGDYAFLLHIIKTIKAGTGKGACILPHGVLFRGSVEKNEAEAVLRKQIVESHIIRGIIGLPANLFYGTGIPACIIILDKEYASHSKGIFMIDARMDTNGKDAFVKDGAKNRLREQDIQRISDAWTNGRTINHYCRLVEWDEIKNNGYNLNIPRYVQPRSTEVQQDLFAHIHGGLPIVDVEEGFGRLWEVCPSLKNLIFESHKDNKGYMQLTPKAEDDIDTLITSDKSYQQQKTVTEAAFARWQKYMEGELAHIDKGIIPREKISAWSAEILRIFHGQCSLIDKYAVYDELMKYWNDECMQDDLYLISRDGWTVSVHLPVGKSGKNKGKVKKSFYYDELECDLVPIDILVNRYFKEEKKQIDKTEQLIDAEQVAMETIVESNSEFFEEVSTENVTDAYIKEVKALVKTAKQTPDEYAEELPIWEDIVKHDTAKNKLKDELKKYRIDLTKKVRAKYDSVTEDEVRTMVFYDKWMSMLSQKLHTLMTTAQQEIIAGVTELNDRYNTTLPEMEMETNHYRDLVQAYLEEMGIKF